MLRVQEVPAFSRAEARGPPLSVGGAALPAPTPPNPPQGGAGLHTWESSRVWGGLRVTSRGSV